MERSSVLNVLRQDILDVRRARLVQGVMTLYILFIGLIFGGVSLTPDQTVYTAIRMTVFLGFLFIPLVSLLAGYLAIAGERDDGTIRYLLGYPVGRAEVLLGKYIARLGLVGLAVAVAFLLGGVIATVGFANSGITTVAAFAALTFLFAGSYVGIAIGVSAISPSRRRAMTLTVVTYFVFTLLWSRISPITVPQIIEGLVNFLFGIQPSGTVWVAFRSLGPAEAYFRALSFLPGGTPFTESGSVSPATVVGILLTWIVVPPLLGYRSFARADID